MHAQKNSRQAQPSHSKAAQRQFPRFRTILAIALVGGLLQACSKPVEKTEDIRPVRVIKLQAAQVGSAFEFAGEVRPRVESRLGFRVGGKIISRKVEIGSQVKRGQVLFSLDPQDLQLALTQAQAGLRAAQSNRDLARAELRRFQELREKNFVSQAVLDAKETGLKAAQASFEQAQALAQVQSNQTNYTNLVADTDGVVSAIDGEVGQVVAAGSPVVRIAQPGEKEVLIGLPENKLDLITASHDVQIRLWANQDLQVNGKVREIAPIADPATRTYAAKISMLNPPPSVRLGMTAYVSFAHQVASSMIRVPLSALYQEKGVTSVWLVENDAVKLVPVTVVGPNGNDMLLGKGVTSGQTVVTAGVNLLKPGQKVKILVDEVKHTPITGDKLGPAASANGAAK